MSHTSYLKNVVLKDLAAMKAAVAALNAKGISCSLLENAQPRMYYSGQGENCEYVLRLNNAKYDVGFQKQKDGTYVPVLDTYQGYVSKEIGAACPMPKSTGGRAQHNIGKFLQEYSKAATINAAIQRGYIVESTETDQDGNIHLVLGNM